MSRKFSSLNGVPNRYEKFPLIFIYSYRNASIGDFRAAWRAG